MTHTADQIIKAMARAIVAQVTSIPDPEEMALAKKQARAAYAECLRMLREPTSSMKYAGERGVDAYYDGGKEDNFRESVGAAFKSMIDTRIKELG